MMRTNAALVRHDGSRALYAILGPCPCQLCGTLVYWARSQTRLDGQTVTGLAMWRERTGRIHRCVPTTISKDPLVGKRTKRKAA